jgi:hypothetical protein
MRTFTLALVATAALAAAPGAFAQMMTSNEGPSGGFGSTVPMPASNGAYNSAHSDTVADKYDLAVMQLKKKVDRVTREDGGKLSAEHAVELQAQLDEVNRQFGARPARRASFGRHDAAPGPSSSSTASSD